MSGSYLTRPIKASIDTGLLHLSGLMVERFHKGFFRHERGVGRKLPQFKWFDVFGGSLFREYRDGMDAVNGIRSGEAPKSCSWAKPGWHGEQIPQAEREAAGACHHMDIPRRGRHRDAAD